MSFFPQGLVSSRPKRDLTVLTSPRCDLCKYCRTANAPKQKVRGRGDVMLVGEFPDTPADLIGKPISGPAAGVVGAVLSTLGLTLADVLYVNALACRPDTKGGEKDVYAAVGHCRPTVWQAVRDRKPAVIIPMGDLAVKSVLQPFRPDGDSMSCQRWAGYQIPLAEFDAWVCPTFGAHYVAVKGSGTDQIKKSNVPRILMQRHVKDACGLRESPVPKIDPAEGLVVNPPEGKTVEWLDGIGSEESEIVAYDFETTGLKPDRKEQHIVCCSVCRGGGETYSFMWTPAVREAMVRMMRRKSVGKIASNLMFETRWCMSKLGTRVANWRWDTMQAAHVFDARGDDPKEGVTSIKFQAFALFGVPPWDAHVKPYLSSGRGKSNGLNRIHELDRRELLIYCGKDSRMEYLVAEKQASMVGLRLEEWK